MTMRAGQLRHPISIQRLDAYTTDAFGQRIPAPYVWATTWAKVEPIGGRELQYAQTFSATVSHKITLRYLAGLLPADRILYGSRLFTIQAVTDPDERNRTHVIYAEEIVQPPSDG